MWGGRGIRVWEPAAREAPEGFPQPLKYKITGKEKDLYPMTGIS